MEKKDPFHGLGQMDAAQMRQLGYQVIDYLVDHKAQLSEKSTHHTATFDELKHIVDTQLPADWNRCVYPAA